MKYKAQSAIEFVILIGAVLFFFVTFLFAIQLNISDKANENRNLALKEIALAVQNEINLAADSSDGYLRQFEVLQEVINAKYEINVTEGVVYARTVDGKHAIAFPVPEVTGDVQKGTNIITKVNGEVFLNS